MVSLGIWVVIAALAPVIVNRYDIAGHELWLVCSLLALDLFAVMFVRVRADAREPGRRAATFAATPRADAWWCRPPRSGCPRLPRPALVLVVLGLFPDQEPALYLTAVALGLFGAALSLLLVVFSQDAQQRRLIRRRCPRQVARASSQTQSGPGRPGVGDRGTALRSTASVIPRRPERHDDKGEYREPGVAANGRWVLSLASGPTPSPLVLALAKAIEGAVRNANLSSPPSRAACPSSSDAPAPSILATSDTSAGSASRSRIAGCGLPEPAELPDSRSVPCPARRHPLSSR